MMLTESVGALLLLTRGHPKRFAYVCYLLQETFDVFGRWQVYYSA